MVKSVTEAMAAIKLAKEVMEKESISKTVHIKKHSDSVYNHHEVMHVYRKVQKSLRVHSGCIYFNSNAMDEAIVSRVYLHLTMREKPFVCVGDYNAGGSFSDYIVNRFYNKSIRCWPLREQLELFDNSSIYDTELWLNEAEANIYLDVLEQPLLFNDFVTAHKCRDNSDSVTNTHLDKQLKNLKNDKL